MLIPLKKRNPSQKIIMSEEIPHWKQQELLTKEKKEKEALYKEKIFGYADLGKVVTYESEYGVLVLTSDFGLDAGPDGLPEVCIRWDTAKEFDFEEYNGGNVIADIVTEAYTFKHINQDGTLKK